MKRILSLITLVTIPIAFIGGCNSSSRVELLQREGKIDVKINGQDFTSYIYESDLTKPVLHPVRTPSGIVVTRGYPLVAVEGETMDHPHHAGVFFTYNVKGNPFWSNAGPSLPQIQNIAIKKIVSGEGQGQLSTMLSWIGKDGKILLQEDRDMVFMAGEDEYAIDFTMKLTARDREVDFEDTKEGMFAIRYADWLREIKGGTGRYLNSNGEEMEKDAWGRRAKWLRLEGEKDGQVVGIAIFNHPSSINWPTYWHARGYGLFAANPLGQFDFQKGRGEENPQHFNLVLKSGRSALFKYRMIIYDGHRTAEQLEQQYEEFAK